MGIFKLAYCICVLATGWFGFGFTPDQMRTLTFAMLVFAGQANVYVLRDKGPFWRSRPSGIMIAASLADVTIVTTFVMIGVLMSPLSPAIVGMLALATLGFALTMDFLKRLVLSRLDIDRRPIQADPLAG